MNDQKAEINDALKDFINVAELAYADVNLDNFEKEFMAAPHNPPSNLPNGKMAIYGFWIDSEWLKIGRVGPKSIARYTSQHYNPNSARSTLAKSLLNDNSIWNEKDKTKPEDIGEWIKNNTYRVNILLDSNHDKLLLALLEAFLHLRLKPRYEQ